MNRFIAAGLLVAMSTAFVHTTTVAGNYYRWLDNEGHVVHSDRPPPKGVDYEVVSTMSTETRQVDAEEGAVAPAAPVPQFVQKPQQATPMEMESKVIKDPEKCQQAQNNLASINSSARIRMRQENGEMAFLTPDQKEAQRQRALDIIAAHCE